MTSDSSVPYNKCRSCFFENRVNF